MSATVLAVVTAGCSDTSDDKAVSTTGTPADPAPVSVSAPPSAPTVDPTDPPSSSPTTRRPRSSPLVTEEPSPSSTFGPAPSQFRTDPCALLTTDQIRAITGIEVTTAESRVPGTCAFDGPKIWDSASISVWIHAQGLFSADEAAKLEINGGQGVPVPGLLEAAYTYDGSSFNGLVAGREYTDGTLTIRIHAHKIGEVIPRDQLVRLAQAAIAHL
ncbi:hypothetical protein LO772_03705 [Yinghuangia sp. ASG 101]|uniref:hypothetical protein n=1 Tax=Yinghuangia sp. ASG 101 TaxID=2896848 RepID=UPI001E3766BC|nr:hypothetical protein [Yinghuangia sp. ASG 101]UGQ12738.1 hypothetical protein LO772_03705 [Yinghuangia sp. ASG 101]